MSAAEFAVWEVVSVPFPYVNRPIEQRRPALVIGRHRGVDSPYLLWVLMLTSASNRAWEGDVAVSDLTEAGLPAATVVRTAKIATIEAADARRLGTLPIADRGAVEHHMAATLGGGFGR